MDASAGQRGSIRAMAIVMAILVVVLAVVSVLAVMQISSLSDANQKLTDDKQHLQQGWAAWNTTVQDHNSATVNEDNNLLLFLYSKLADESDSKSLMTISHV